QRHLKGFTETSGFARCLYSLNTGAPSLTQLRSRPDPNRNSPKRAEDDSLVRSYPILMNLAPGMPVCNLTLEHDEARQRITDSRKTRASSYAYSGRVGS